MTVKVTTEERLVGDNEYVTVDMTDLLATGETITGTPTLTASNALVTVQGGTVAVSGDGKSISARFLHNGAGTTRVDISCGTTLSGVVKKTYFFFKTYEPPPAV
jgi:hypothetical protein